jgi:hypothetical protein
MKRVGIAAFNTKDDPLSVMAEHSLKPDGPAPAARQPTAERRGGGASSVELCRRWMLPPLGLLNTTEKNRTHHGFYPGCHLLGGDAVGRLIPAARGSENGPGRCGRQQRRIDTGR